MKIDITAPQASGPQSTHSPSTSAQSFYPLTTIQNHKWSIKISGSTLHPFITDVQLPVLHVNGPSPKLDLTIVCNSGASSYAEVLNWYQTATQHDITVEVFANNNSIPVLQYVFVDATPVTVDLGVLQSPALLGNLQQPLEMLVSLKFSSMLVNGMKVV